MAQKPRILLADDSTPTVEGIKSHLELKYEVITAFNGLDALKIAQDDNNPIDLIITDLIMPHISGYAIISLLKQKTPDIPVIAITGWGQHPRELATESKADLVLNKPFELEDLDLAISRILPSNP